MSSETPPAPDRPPTGRRRWRRHLPQLPLGTRVLLHAVGGSLVVLGIAGLVLPGLQGVLLILAGAAVLSLASAVVHRWLRLLFTRWPGGWKRVERLRRWLHDKLSRDPD